MVEIWFGVAYFSSMLWFRFYSTTSKPNIPERYKMQKHKMSRVNEPKRNEFFGKIVEKRIELRDQTFNSLGFSMCATEPVHSLWAFKQILDDPHQRRTNNRDRDRCKFQ